MFRKKKSGVEQPRAGMGGDEPTLKLKGGTEVVKDAGAERAARRGREAPRRPVTLPVTARRIDRSLPPHTEGKKLIVGREISLSGEITSCEKLVVEGRVNADLTGCREIEITKSGHFKGRAEIETAEVAGHFEGALTVRDRLLVRATGRIDGDVRYGRLEVECGGRIFGTLGTVEQAAGAPVAAVPKRTEVEVSG